MLLLVAQISPGELYGVVNSLEFAKDLVKVWLEKYKFKNWTVTRTKKTLVNDDLRKQRACDVAEMFCNHTTWRTHGRSLKIDDLNEVLIIQRIDDDPKLADLIYRIKTIIRLIFDGSTTYKLFYLDDLKLAKTFTISPSAGVPLPFPFPQPQHPQKRVEAIELDIQCPKCNKRHSINGYMDISSQEIQKSKLKTNSNVKDNDMLECDNCKFVLDLKPIKSQIETQTKRKVTFK